MNDYLAFSNDFIKVDIFSVKLTNLDTEGLNRMGLKRPQIGNRMSYSYSAYAKTPRDTSKITKQNLVYQPFLGTSKFYLYLAGLTKNS